MKSRVVPQTCKIERILHDEVDLCNYIARLSISYLTRQFRRVAQVDEANNFTIPTTYQALVLLRPGGFSNDRSGTWNRAFFTGFPAGE
jgi:hypothetical protein